MNEYEITYISDPQLTEEAREQLDTALETKISDLSGATVHATEGLRRRLAYPIDKKTTGFLRALHIELAPEHIADIQQFLKKDAGVMRFTILNTKQRQATESEIVERHTQKKNDKKKTGKPSAKPARPAKKVTMEAVEKGIEDALTEEIK